eukprot:TRINITY_DN12752_c0_g1_i1.p1 TRINITY_DN12752_c0_g1~~TRINITY_DN12752_c0_g1_i1.p1  ORF type:complete len:366 (-),score=76.72 TRINITY_DN12752_c0_g1_i1:4-1038(-)
MSFREAIKAIRDYSFATSPYPVIMSFENHCSVPQQDIMADILIEYLGPYFPPPLRGDTLPSPDQLRGCIIIKGKTLTPAGKGPPLEGQKIVKLSQKLSDITWLKAVTFPGFELGMERLNCFEMSSFSEMTCLKFPVVETIRYNAKLLSRIYPKGSRINSDNYDPYWFWPLGCQMVALNYQTNDKEMYLNYGFFLENGNSGYIAKPPVLRDTATNFNPTTCLTPDPHSTVRRLSVKVLSGNFSHVSKLNHIEPVVHLSVHGITYDTTPEPKKTTALDDFTPSWDEKPFVFGILMSSIATLLIAVYDNYSKQRIAHYCIPLECIRNGVRTIFLREEENHNESRTLR